MSVSNRAARITKLQTALKKHYKPLPVSSRPLMEHLLYACLLEGSPAELADEGLAKLEQQYFDWNEVRVTTIAEIAEVLSNLPQPMMAATRLKRCLQSAFEAFYAFDLEELKKENLGKAVEQLEALPGMTPFVCAYVTQQGLGGHSIPVDNGGLRLMYACGIIDAAEMATRRVPGLERAIPKSKGADFGSLLQQASVTLREDLNHKTIRAIITAVDKEGVERLAEAPDLSRRPPVSSELVDPQEAEETKAPAKKKSTKKAAEKPTKKPAKKSSSKASSSSDSKQAGDAKKKAKQATPEKKAAKSSGEGKKESKKATKKAAKKPTTKKAKSTKSPSKKLTKRKPR